VASDRIDTLKKCRTLKLATRLQSLNESRLHELRHGAMTLAVVTVKLRSLAQGAALARQTSSQNGLYDRSAMADRLTLDHDEPSLLPGHRWLAFWFRNQAAFWLVALPIAGLGAASLRARPHQSLRAAQSWGWDFLFALIYADVLDRWMKVLAASASPCDESTICVARSSGALPGVRRLLAAAGDDHERDQGSRASRDADRLAPSARIAASSARP